MRLSFAIVGCLPVLLAMTGCPPRHAPPPPTDASTAPSAAKTQPSETVIFLSADMRGYLGPCGCSENMRGGLPRAAAHILRAKQGSQVVLFLEGGDSLFRQATLPPATIPQEERKARAIADIWKQMGLNLRATGELDLARGPDFLDRLSLPTLKNEAFVPVSAGPANIGVVSAPDWPTLQKRSREARNQGAPFVLGFLHQTWQQATAALVASGPGPFDVDVIVVAHGGNEAAGEENRFTAGAVPLIQIQSKGRSLGQLTLTWGGTPDAHFELLKTQADTERTLAGLDQRIELLRAEINAPGLNETLMTLKQEKLAELVERRAQTAASPLPVPEGKNAFSVRFVPLESTLPSDPAAVKIVEAYDRDVGALNLAWAKEHGRDCPKPAKGQAAFVGNAACRDCHAEAFPVWEKSKHATALKSLEAKGQRFHLDCIGCHVTGMDQPGGVCRIDRLEGREHVGCESCHGPGSLHVSDPSLQKMGREVTAQTCVGCHDPENSPHFDFAQYLPKILGPGHGAKK